MATLLLPGAGLVTGAGTTLLIPGDGLVTFASEAAAMTVAMGDNVIAAMAIGDTAVTAISVGDTQLWP